jgi:hypothetical protein
VDVRGRTALLGHGGAEITCLSPAVYRFVKAQRPAVPDPPASGQVASAETTDSPVTLLPAGKDRWSCHVDGTRLRFRGAAVDHVPGMVLITAAAQVAAAWTGSWNIADDPDGPVRIDGVDARFLHYTNLVEPIGFAVEAATPDTIDVTGAQGDKTVVRAIVNIRNRRDCSGKVHLGRSSLSDGSAD